MVYQKLTLTKILSSSIRIGLILCLFTPLIVSSFTYFPFVVGKAIFFQILVELILLLYLILALIAPQYRPRFNWLTGTVLIYFLIATVASVIGVNPRFSFWTNYERMDGLFNLYHFGAYFLVLFAMMKNRKLWLQFFRILLVSFLMIDFLGILQKLGLSSLSQFGGERAFSTLGNATYLGTLAVFQVFVSVFLFFGDRSFWWRLFYGLSFLMGILAVLIGQTRGALLALYIGTLIFLILASLFQGEKKERRGFILALATFVLLSGVFLLAIGQSSSLAKLLPKRLNAFSGAESLGARPYAWQISLDAWKSRFLLGWGRGASIFVFPHFYNPEISSKSFVWFDKPHNKILEVGVDAGIIGVLSYLSIFGIALYLIWRSRREFSLGSYTLIALVSAYFIQNLFLFDSEPSYLWWFTILAFIGFLNPKKNRENSLNKEKYFSPQYLALLGLSVILIIWSFIYGNIRPFTAASRGIRALTLEYRGEPSQVVLPIYQSALRLKTFGNLEILAEMVKPFHAIDRRRGKKEFANYVDFATQEEQEALSANPVDLKDRMVLGSLYQMKASYAGSLYLDKAQKLYENFAKEAPRYINSYYSLAYLALDQKQDQKALQYLKKAFQLNPNYYRSSWELARFYFMSHNSNQGEIYLAKSINLGLPWSYLLKAKFISQKDSKELVKIFERMAQAEPNWVKPPLILAGIYGNMKKTRQMVNYLRKAIEINPRVKPSIEKLLGVHFKPINNK